MKNKHTIIMILTFGIPLLLLVFLPFFGFSQDDVFTLAIFLMFGLHFLSMGSHGHGHQENHQNNTEIKNSNPLVENDNTTSHAKHDLHRKPQKR